MLDADTARIRLISARAGNGSNTRTNLDKVKVMNPTQHDDDMPKEIDFSKGTRGKFYRKDAQLQLPIHLEASVQNTLAALANAKGVDLSVFVNELLKKDIELIQMSR
ncbi:MAG TPA: hypothetical protein VIQ03_01535 [Gammaproteobacteria bacterium]